MILIFIDDVFNSRCTIFIFLFVMWNYCPSDILFDYYFVKISENSQIVGWNALINPLNDRCQPSQELFVLEAPKYYKVLYPLLHFQVIVNKLSLCMTMYLQRTVHI